MLLMDVDGEADGDMLLMDEGVVFMEGDMEGDEDGGGMERQLLGLLLLGGLRRRRRLRKMLAAKVLRERREDDGEDLAPISGEREALDPVLSTPR